MIPPLLLCVSVLTFVLLRIVPGDAAVARAGLAATPERVEKLRHELGLNRSYFPLSLEAAPPFVAFHSDSQYWSWLKDALRGDFGRSHTFQRPVAAEVGERAPVTVELLLLSALVAVCVGVPLGIMAAARRNGPLDYLVRAGSVLCLAVPAFWLGTMLLLFPAIWWNWAPPVDYVHIWDDPLHNLEQLALPVFALSAAPLAGVIRITRAAMLDVLRNDFIRTAWAKGLRERQVMARHAVRNAMIPVLSFASIQFLTLLGGAVLIEQLFNLNGLGQLLYTGVFSRDYALVQALVLLSAVTVLLVNLAVDLAYGLLDPRIRYT
jgi:peptide/nickel transport system permease protein